MKNNLVVIGYMSGKSCYLNIPVEEAIKRYVAAHSIEELTEVKPHLIKEISFDDEFCAYDVWEK